MKVEISLGELVDKVTILAIKLQKIVDPEKLKNIRKEYDLLHRDMVTAGITETSMEYDLLIDVNRNLWDIEDRIREKESAKSFDVEFIELARSVYFKNDARAAVKREINIKFGSDLIEEKSYSPYK